MSYSDLRTFMAKIFTNVAADLGPAANVIKCFFLSEDPTVGIPTKF